GVSPRAHTAQCELTRPARALTGAAQVTGLTAGVLSLLLSPAHDEPHEHRIVLVHRAPLDERAPPRVDLGPVEGAAAQQALDRAPDEALEDLEGPGDDVRLRGDLAEARVVEQA